jgi:hypothetical protein
MIGFLLTKDTAVLFFARTALEIKSSGAQPVAME